ncbi:hypothetical protein Stsp01_64570 [Streptomyces sp. NBRC 13847]|nr:hypothetical protein Stsp01_64570 [Streptomyces sp. NBRC 13847]
MSWAVTSAVRRVNWSKTVVGIGPRMDGAARTVWPRRPGGWGQQVVGASLALWLSRRALGRFGEDVQAMRLADRAASAALTA